MNEREAILFLLGASTSLAGLALIMLLAYLL